MPRTARTADLMWLRLFRRFDGRADTLQGQLRDMIVQAVLDGLLQPGAALPSSRLLATRLGVSRTTVTLALDALAQQAFLRTRARSGYFVGDDARSAAAPAPPTHIVPDPAAADRWARRIQLTPSTQRNIEKPRDWQQQPYPFVVRLWPVRRFCIPFPRLAPLRARIVAGAIGLPLGTRSDRPG